MGWQDIVISIANIFFIVSLMPQVYHGFKQKKGFIMLATSIPTCMALYVIAISFLTLSLWSSAIVTFVSGTMWLLLVIQGIIYKKA